MELGLSFLLRRPQVSFFFELVFNAIGLELDNDLYIWLFDQVMTCFQPDF